METLKVMKAAIRLSDCRVFSVEPPGRHHDVIKLISELVANDLTGGVEEGSDQGFILSDGSFVLRKEAAQVAYAAEQLLKRRLEARGVDPEQCPLQLYSEDVW